MISRVTLTGFEVEAITLQRRTLDVYTAGKGPPVIVIHGLPGIEPSLADFGLQLARVGFTAVLPSLFGEPGRPISNTYLLRTQARAAFSRDFSMWSARPSRITDWLTMLAANLGQRHDDKVAVVGNSISGDFGLQMMSAEAVATAVLANPALPIGLGSGRRGELGLGPREWEVVRRRVAAGRRVLGLRFTDDVMVPNERFARLREELGDSFIAFEIDSSPGNEHSLPKHAHSVITDDGVASGFVDVGRLAVIDFLSNQLGVQDRPVDVSKWEQVKIRQREIRHDLPSGAPRRRAGDVFVSYAREDSEYVDRLIDHLSGDIPGVWSDERLQTGDSWSKVLRDRIDAAAAVIVVMSPHSSDSDWVTKEVLFALTRKKPVFPLLLGGEPMFELIDKEYCDVSDGALPPPSFVGNLRRQVA